MTRLSLNGTGLMAYAALLSIGFALPASAQSGKPLPKEDTQLWHEVQAVVHARKNVDWISAGMIRFGYNATDLIYERFSTGVSFKLGKHFSLAPGYGYYAFQPTDARDIREHRFTLDGTLHWSFGKLNVSDRNRFERRFFASGLRFNRYRNRIQVEHPLRVGSRRLRLVVSDEVLYEGAVDAWTRNRFSTGAGIHLQEGMELEVYYMRQNDRYVRPGDLNVIGTNLRFSFF